MTRKRNALPFLLLLLTLLSGCGTGDLSCIAPGNPLCGSRGPSGPPADPTPFLGTWLNEDLQPGQVTRIEVYEKTVQGENLIYARIWEMCGPEECAFEEREAFVDWYYGGKLRLDAYGRRDDIERLVHARLFQLSDTRAQATVTFGTLDGSFAPATYYFTKAH